MLLYILLGVIAATLIALLVFLIVNSAGKNRKDTSRRQKDDNSSSGELQRKSTPTTFDDSEPGSAINVEPRDEYTIAIKDIRSARSWRFAVKDRLVIGRGSDCDLVLEDERVSHKHVQISATDDGLYVRNISNTNGLKVNGQRIDQEIPLKPGDELRIGHEELLIDSISSLSGRVTHEIKREPNNLEGSVQARTKTKGFF